MPTSNVMLACDDVEATYRELVARGVEFSDPPAQLAFGWWSVFRDPEGNRYALIPRP